MKFEVPDTQEKLRTRYRIFLHTVFLADISEAALFAVRRGSGGADFPAVVYQSVAEVAAFFWRNDFPECHLHFFRLFDIIYQTDTVGETDAMGIG